jgi:hypothetical protein
MWTPWRHCCADRLQCCGGCCRDDHMEEAIVIDYFLYTDARLRWITTPTLLPLLSTFSGRRWSWSTNSSTPTCNYIGLLLQLFIRHSVHLVVMTIYDPFTCKFPVCNGRCSASVAYPLPYNGIRAVFHSFWSGLFVARLWLDELGLKSGGSWLCHVIEWLVHVLSLLCARHVSTGWNHHQD